MLTLLHRPPAQTITIPTSFFFFTAASTPPLPPPPPPLDASIAASILAATPQTLPRVLQDPTIQWTPELVDKTLKRLWNHAPMALSFFAHLFRRRPAYAPAASSFDHAVDLAARVRDFRAAWALVARMRSLRLGPSPKTLAIIAERSYGWGCEMIQAVERSSSLLIYPKRKREEEVERSQWLFFICIPRFHGDFLLRIFDSLLERQESGWLGHRLSLPVAAAALAPGELSQVRVGRWENLGEFEALGFFSGGNASLCDSLFAVLF